MSVFTAVLPVVTLIVGSVLTMGADSWRDARAVKAADAARAKDHDREAQARRDAFELENLHRVLVAAHEFLRQAIMDHNAQVRASEETGRPYGTISLGPDAPGSEAERLASRELMFAKVLILDDDLRQQVDDFQNLGAQLGSPLVDLAGARAVYTKLSHLTTDLFSTIGERVRQLYEVSPEYHEAENG